jgi:hypothetical protein
LVPPGINQGLRRARALPVHTPTLALTFIPLHLGHWQSHARPLTWSITWALTAQRLAGGSLRAACAGCTRPSRLAACNRPCRTHRETAAPGCWQPVPLSRGFFKAVDLMVLRGEARKPSKHKRSCLRRVNGHTTVKALLEALNSSVVGVWAVCVAALQSLGFAYGVQPK